MPPIENLEMEVIHEASQANEMVEIGKESDNCNNRRMRISYRLRPILQLMKLAGEYYGDSSLLETPQGGSSYCSRFTVEVCCWANASSLCKQSQVFSLKVLPKCKTPTFY